jgi:uncharacterized spore protein YtfJ
MAEEKKGKTTETENTNLQLAITDVTQNIDTFLDSARVERVYGEPIQVGDTVIIPTAEILVGLGFGMGVGYGRSEDESKDSGGGAGGGGGGKILSRPVAVVIATPESVRVEPVFDTTKIALAGLTAAGFMIGMIARMMRGRS